MKFYLKKALKDPIGLGILIMALFSALPLFANLASISWSENGIKDTLLAYLIVLFSYLMVLGYTVTSGHRYLHKIKPFAPVFSMSILWNGIKSVFFSIYLLITGLLFIVPLLLIWTGILELTTHPTLLFIFIPAILATVIAIIFYTLVSYARFMDSLNPFEAFYIPSNCALIKDYWTKLVRTVLYLIGVFIILLIPFIVIYSVGLFLMSISIASIYLGVYIISLTQCYATLVNTHVLAQVYSWIKLDMEENEEPVIMKDIVILEPAKKVKPALSKVAISKKTTPKTTPKKSLPKVVSKTIQKAAPQKKTVKK